MVLLWFYLFTFPFKYDSFGIDPGVRCENGFNFSFFPQLVVVQTSFMK